MNFLRNRDILTAIRLVRYRDITRAKVVLRHFVNSARALKRTPGETAKGQFLSRSFRNDAGSRAYKLYIPSTYDREACPLIVMLHGCKQSANDFADGTQMNVLAEKLTFLVAYPEQPVRANMWRCWNWFSRADQQRDLGEPSIVAGITRQVMDDYLVDRRRVYVAGISAGGGAAAVLGATYPDVFAAIGVHSGVAYGIAHDALSGLAAMRDGPAEVALAERAVEQHLIPTIVFAGDEDATVNPRNADQFAAAIPALQLNKQIETGRVPDGRAYTRTWYNDARGHCLLEQWTIHGAGHAWSGGSPSGTYTDPQGPDASWEFARFFLGSRRSGSDIPTSGPKAALPKLTPIA